jgi:hypothetical protein
LRARLWAHRQPVLPMLRPLRGSRLLAVAALLRLLQIRLRT